MFMTWELRADSRYDSSCMDKLVMIQEQDWQWISAIIPTPVKFKYTIRTASLQSSLTARMGSMIT